MILRSLRYLLHYLQYISGRDALSSLPCTTQCRYHGRIHHWGRWGNFSHQDFDPWNLLGNFPSKNPVQTWHWPCHVRCLIFCTQNLATPEKKWAKSEDFSVVGRGYLGSQLPGDFWYVPGFPISPEAADTPLVGTYMLKARLNLILIPNYK